MKMPRRPMFRPHAEAEQAGRQAAQEGPARQQPDGKRRLEFPLCGERAAHHLVLQEHLDRLCDPRREFAPFLHPREVGFRESPITQWIAQDVRGRDRILHGKIYADTADR